MELKTGSAKSETANSAFCVKRRYFYIYSSGFTQLTSVFFLINKKKSYLLFTMLFQFIIFSTFALLLFKIENKNIFNNEK